MKILHNSVSVYTSYEPTAINIVTGSTGIHTPHIIGICPSTNIPTTLYIHAHCTATAFYTPQYCIYRSHKQLSATLIHHAVAIYVSKTNISLKCLISATYINKFMCRYNTTRSVYMLHINSLQTKM